MFSVEYKRPALDSKVLNDVSTPLLFQDVSPELQDMLLHSSSRS